jgi:hypothetical protein
MVGCAVLPGIRCTGTVNTMLNSGTRPPAVEQAGRIVVVGSLNADLTIYCERLPLPGETVHGNGFAVNPGGKSANQAVAASRLGGNVSLVGAVGEDPNGSMLLSSAAGSGVDVGHVRTSPEPTGVAVIAVDAGGENNIIISAGANGTLSPADVAAASDVLEEAAVVCLCLEVSMDTVLAAARAGHDAGAQQSCSISRLTAGCRRSSPHSPTSCWSTRTRPRCSWVTLPPFRAPMRLLPSGTTRPGMGPERGLPSGGSVRRW